MEKSRGRTWPIKVISVILALFLWVYVTHELNPTKEQVLRQISLDPRRLSPALTILDMPNYVDLRVQGNQNVLADLSGKSVEVWVDLSGAVVGKNRLPVQVKLPPGIRLIDVRPAEVTVQVDRMTEKHAHVKVDTIARPAGGYRSMRPVARPSQVIVKGPEKVLARIDTVLAQVDLANRTGNALETVPVQAVDGKGKVIDQPGVEVVPGEVEVFVPIVVELPSKTAPVKVPVTGAPAEGLVVKAVIPENKTIIVTGTREALAGIAEITTEAVDVNGAKEDVIKTVRPVLPAGVTSPGTPEVRVLVEIRPKAESDVPEPESGVPPGSNVSPGSA